MDFLEINANHYGIAAMPTRMSASNEQPARAYGDEGVFWFLAFESAKDAQEWYDVSAMEF